MCNFEVVHWNPARRVRSVAVPLQAQAETVQAEFAMNSGFAFFTADSNGKNTVNTVP